MKGMPRKVKIATAHIDDDGRVTFPQPNEAPPDDGWWDSVLSDPRARMGSANDKQLGYFVSMFVEIYCRNCSRHDLHAVNDLVKRYGRDCDVDAAVNKAAPCSKSAKSCELDFKIRQWEDVQKIRLGQIK